MRRLLALTLFSVVLALPGLAENRPPAGAVMVITVNQAITGGTTSYIRSALERATLDNAMVLIIQLDTPGGLLSSTRDIVQDILNARVPVVVYISPPGARGASAGTMLTLASHVAAMAPATHIGAAHPVSLFGGGDDKIMAEKILNDTSAYVEAIAELRHRNVKWAISAVRESKSITAAKAKELGVIEIVADNLEDLIQQLDGRAVRMDKATTIKLATAGKPPLDLDMSFSQSFLTTLSNPNLVFFLLALGALGLYIEFSHPGLILPGVVGAISLITALIALQTLPISYGALGLILLGMALLVAETFVPSFGVLGLGGIASILFGALFLLDPSRTDLLISRPMIFITVGTLGVVALVIGRLLLRSLRAPARSFQSTMVGRSARVKEPIAPDRPGSVLVNGELWRASAAVEVPAEALVVIEAVEGLQVRVAPVEAIAQRQQPPSAAPA
ncbi:MAG TPA: nodulation protein NfeD [bacterium]|jgi:membrane-bound serine protease (ClpP class)